MEEIVYKKGDWVKLKTVSKIKEQYGDKIPAINTFIKVVRGLPYDNIIVLDYGSPRIGWNGWNIPHEVIERLVERPIITIDSFGHPTLHFHEGELPTPDPYLIWLDEKIESAYNAEIKKVSDNPKFWCGMKMAFIEALEKYLSLHTK